jgi:Leucine Rich repeats (2 copies)
MPSDTSSPRKKTSETSARRAFRQAERSVQSYLLREEKAFRSSGKPNKRFFYGLSLTGLNDFDTHLEDIPSAISECTSLEWLNISGSKISDLSPLQGLPRLEKLSLINTLVSDLTPLRGLPRLSHLYASTHP